MRRIRATDFRALTRCDRQLYLNLHGDPAQRLPPTPYQSWLRQRGQTYEKQVAEQFAGQTPPYTVDNLDLGFEITLGFMREGVPLIAQGVLIDGDLVGIPDLLERVEGASRLGAYHYRPLDIKSAARAREDHRLQVMAYLALLEAIQGVRPEGKLLLRPPSQNIVGALREAPLPETLYVEEVVQFDETLFAAHLAEARRLAGGEEPPPFLSSECAACGWRDLCIPIIEQAGDASLVSGLRRGVWRQLHTRGLGALSALAGVDPGDLLEIKGVGEKTAPAIVNQARALATREAIRLAAPSLPPPGPALFFDVESVPTEGLYYLMGLLTEDSYTHDLAEHPGDEGRMWSDFLTRITRMDGPVYHYGSYERAAIKTLDGRFGPDARATALLDRMVDLEKTLKASAVLPLRGYSLKEVAPWLGFQWSGETATGEDSILEYMGWLADGDKAHLDRILRYNEDDCRATRAVLDWLRDFPA